jgi:hypothetical protein
MYGRLITCDVEALFSNKKKKKKKFENWDHSHKHPFAIYADFESTLE